MSVVYSIYNKVVKDRFVLVLVIYHLLFFLYNICYNTTFILLDSEEYYNLASNILNHFEFYSGNINDVIEIEDYTKRPPLYSIFILVFSLFLKSYTLLFLVQNVLSISSILIVKSIFEASFGKSKRVVLFLFIFLSLSQFIYANLMMSEMLLQFLITLSIYLLYLIISQKRTSYLWYYQLLVILLFLTKPVFYLFVIPNILVTFLVCRQIKVRFGTLKAIIPIVAVMLYCQWNYNRTGSYNFSSIQQINLVNYNLRYFHTNKYGVDYAQNINSKIKEESEAVENYKNRLKLKNELVAEYIKKDLLSYGIFHIKGSARFFVDPGRFDIANFFNLKNSDEVGILKHLNENGVSGVIDYFKTQSIIIILLFVTILALSIVKFIGFTWFVVGLFKQNKLLWWIVIGIIIYISALTGPLGAARFIVPVLPFYTFASIYGITALWKRIKGRSKVTTELKHP